MPRTPDNTGQTHGITRVGLGAAVLAVATAVLVLRLPGSVMLMAAAPVLSLLITGVHRPPSAARPLWVFLGVATLAAFTGVFINPVGIGLVNFATLGLTFTLFSVAVLCSGDHRRVARVILSTLYWAFVFALLVGLGEMALDFKLQSVLYPEASNLKFAGRYVVAAWLPNYNDYAVIITMLALMVMARFLFDGAAGLARQLGRALIFIVALGVIVIGGSRGALLGLLVGGALLLVHSIRVVRPKLITALPVIVGSLAALGGALALWFSPWVQDHSTSVRNRIIANTIEVTPIESTQFWLGWGDLGRFTDVTSRIYPGLLLDPHNVILEVFTWFGFPALVALAWLWAYVAWRGLWRMEVAADWHSIAGLFMVALIPVLGVVPSSSLRYYYLFLLLPCAISALRPQEQDV